MMLLLSALLLVAQPVDTAETVEQAAEATEAAAEAAAEAAEVADEAAEVAVEAAAEASEAADEAAAAPAVKEEKICRTKFSSDNKFGGRNSSRKVCKTRAEWENDRRKR